MVFKVQNKNKSAVQKSSTEDVIIIDDDDSDGGDTITAEADNADQQDEVIIIDENGRETKVGPSKVTELRQQATSKKNCENSSKKRSRSTDMEDFEKFCRHFNKKISALKDSDLEITVKGSSSENGINDTAFEGDENLVFKKPQRFRRRTTAPSMEVSLGPASCERLTRVRNNNNSVKQNNEPFDIVDGEIKAIENLENVSIMNVKVTKVQPKSGPKSDSANSTNETISSSPPQTPLPRGRPPKNSPRYRQKQMTSNATSNGAGGPSHSVTRSGSRPTSPLEISAPKTAPNTPENTPQKKQAEQLTPTKKNHSSPSVQVDNVATSSNSSNSTINNAPTKSPHHRNGNNPHYYSRTTSTFSPDKNEEFRFEKPGECPIFEPNAEEFKNPLAYISKIRPIAEKYGICKIRPPKAWTPPFTVDVDKLRFTPRVQRLNELEAKTRVKLNFLDQIAKFWELQGSSLKIPMVERKALDLYSLHRIVQEEGGMEVATKDRKWSRIGQRLGYPAGKNVGTILRGHYERILHPFDVYTSGKVVDSKLETDDDDKDYKPHGIVSRQQITPPNETTARRSKRFANSNASCGLGSAIMDEKFCKIEKFEENQKATDYRRLHLYGTGTKPGNNRNSRSRMSNVPNFMSPHKKTYEEYDPLAKYICQTCNRGDVEEAMLLCDGCDDSYHTFCLIPPLSDIPKGDWRCPKCVVEEVSKPQDAFGFEQASREYTLQQFGEMADHFKSDYFNMAVHLVPTDLVEREFWRIVSSIDEDVTVEYGADLHTMDHGSGFPTKNSLYLLPNDEEYADSSWNLNNLPLLEESVLGHINADISGMKVPWMYVGMCFATFCWHNEDHWSYSINYLHWGEAKTWYGVPGDHAESFEKTMRSAAPELFQSQPDLLHQLVTIMNPNILMGSGVPVYRTDQHAGEFVITFPRAYHAGFNQGYNFAEAVNFAPADWMKMGRECINHYSKLRRFCVFSHDELVCKMALDPDRLNLSIATACYLDMVQMVDCEKKLRKSLLEWGVTKAEREPFELLPDDGRQCESCKTTVFLSAVSCTCTQAIVCLRHYTELCKCHPENYTLKYRYTLDELPLMLKKLKVKAESFENWLTKVRDVLDPSTPVTLTLEELQELALEAVTKKFPRSILLDRLNSAVIEAKKCVTVIQQLDINKMRTRTRNSNESAKYRLTLTELDLFVEEINNLCCIIQEGESVRKLQSLGKEFVEMSDLHLAKPLEMVDAKVIERLIDVGSMLCIELAEVKVLKRRLDQVNWYNQIDQYAKSNEKKTVEEIKALKKEGLALIPDPAIDKQIEYLENIIIGVEEWERLSQKCFESGTQHQLEEIDEILKKAESIPATLPSQPNLKDAVKRTKDWLQNLEILQERETYPYFHTLQSVVERGRGIPFQLEELARMEDHLNSAQLWKDRTARTFLKKNTNCSLLEILSPRIDAINLGPKGKKKIAEEIFSEEMGPPQVVNAFKNAEEKELKDMRELRKLNDAKHPLEDKFCICKRKFHGLMFHCQLCKDWFHEGCVPTPRHTVRPRPRTSNTTPPGTSNILPISIQERDFEPKYLCPTCMRSRKPRLESILGLLVSLQRLPMRLPEGEALQCLTERAMNWQDRARQAFATEDVAAALTALSITTQKNNDTEGPKSAESTTQHNDDETSKVEEQKPVEDESVVISSDEEENPEQTNENDIGKQNEAAISTAKIEHAYSVPPSTVPNDVQSSNIANSPHKPDMPLIHLCKSTKDKLKDLMMEGDLLEVSLDETLHIWQVLNAAKPYITELACLNYRYNISNTKTDVLVNNVKKRRSDDITGPPPKRVAKCTVGDKSAVQKAKKGRKMKTVTKQNTNDSKKKKRGKKTKRTAAAGSSSDDEEEECSAPVCEKPDGTEVDWVQCDGYCNNWFHMLCVGLDKNSIKPEEDFICELCKSTGAKPSSEHGTVILTISTASVQSSPKSSNSPIPMLSPSDISTSSSTLTATETPVKSDIQFPSIQSTLNVLDVISTPSETESLSEKNLSSPTVVRS